MIPLLLGMLFFSCQKEQTIDVDLSSLSTVRDVIEEARGKNLILILEQKDCTPCYHYKQDIKKLTESSPNMFFDKTIIRSIDFSRPNNLVLNQIMAEYASPMTLFFSKQGDLIGFMKGSMSKEIPEILDSLSQVGYFYRSNKVPFLRDLNNNIKSNKEKITFLNEMLKLYTPHLDGFNEREANVKQIKMLFDRQPYFLNQYLMAKSLYTNNQVEKGKALAADILKDYSSIDVLLYPNFLKELMYMSDTSYSEESKPLLAVGETEINFGKEKVGIVKELNISFINKGKSPLLLKHVLVSCSCLEVKWPKETIPVGSKGNIFVRYKLENEGEFYQNMRIFSNADVEPLEIKIKGVVNK